ncbi:MAG: GntR family transcriptional regulator [Lentisphaerae bacterium]|nr:GntR family transcriptional regulator [Lentisphaerota bacterium]
MDSAEKPFVLCHDENAPSLHRQLVSGLSAEFAALPPGTAVPSTAELKKRFNVAYMTITRALDELVVRGDIVRFQGKGTFTAARSNATIYYLIHCPLELKVERNPILDSAIAQTELSGGKIRLVPLTNNDVQGDVNWNSVKTIPPGALVLLDSISNYRYIIEYLIQRECKIALVNSRPEYYLDWQPLLEKIHNIYFMRKECVCKAVELMAARGRKNLFLVHEGPSWDNPIRTAFRETLSSCGLEFKLSNELYATAKPGQCRSRMRTLQHRLDDIDGIITVYPHHALEIYKLLKERSRRIPEDVSLISLQDSPLLAANTIGITAFDSNLAACGCEAVKLLYSPQTAPAEIYVDYIYHARNSV